MCSQVKGKSVKYLKIPDKGYLGEAYVLGIKQLNKSGWSLKKAFKFSSSLRYYDHDYVASTSEKLSIRGFKNHHGNCYVMAATFYIQAKLLGYNVRQMKGSVVYPAPHSWTEIKHGGKWRVYDPDFTQETGRNGYNIYYGKSGTWRYNHYHVFQK